MKRFSLVFLSLILCVSLASCQQELYGHCELSLNLSEEYKITESEGFDKTFTNGTYVVGILRISFNAGFNQGIPETLSAREFAKFWQNKLGVNYDIHNDRVTPYYTYDKDGYFYISGFYRSKYAYFVVLMSAPELLYPDCISDFTQILDGASFKY
jgi:hypothetical protein